VVSQVGIQEGGERQEMSATVKSSDTEPEAVASGKFVVAAGEDDINFVFSTSCNLFQHWQAQALLASAKKVGQRGHITRIVSGCNYEADKGLPNSKHMTHPVGLNDQLVPLTELQKTVFDRERFTLHVTPTFEGQCLCKQQLLLLFRFKSKIYLKFSLFCLVPRR